MKPWICLFASLILPPSLDAGTAPLPLRDAGADKISIASRADKTALWPGDLVTYTVQVLHDPEIEFVLDYLNPEKLSLNPFVIRSLAFAERVRSDRKKLLEIAFLLSAYETGKSELVIPAFSLFYFRRELGFRKSDLRESIAQSVRVTPFTLGLRSTLTGGQLKLRDYKPFPETDRRLATSALAVGLAGMICVAGVGARQARRRFRSGRRTAPKKASRRNQARITGKRLAAIQALRQGSPEEIQSFYGETDRFLREILQQRFHIEAAGLTPEEIEKALKESSVHSSLGPEIKTVLDQCDRVRYGKDSMKAAGELSAQIAEALERIVRSAGE